MLNISIRKNLRGFSLDVNFHSDSLITVLFAPSGSGKSLTLQAIAGLIEPDWGRIEINGTVFFDSEKRINLPPQMRKVGFLFQDYALFPHMKVIDNVRFGSESDDYVNELLKVFEIELIKDNYPSQISGGQKQRVALARALASKPRILLLDEPFSALHKTLKLQLYNELRRIKENFNIPVVLVTHDIDEVFELADNLVVMNRGKVVQIGEPFEIFMNPANMEVAKLLGHRSFIKGVVKKVEQNFTVVETKYGLIKCRSRKGVFPGDSVFLSILPFSIALSPSVESTRVTAFIKGIEREREFKKIIANVLGTDIELLIPLSLSPSFIIERGRSTEIYLSADSIPIVMEA